MTETDSTVMHDSVTDFIENADGLVIKRQQEIPQSLIDDLKERRVNSDHKREGEFMLACSIPVIIHEKWLREGYDCTREPARKTIARLKTEGLDAFIATNKQL
jgi:hypothetical protein